MILSDFDIQQAIDAGEFAISPFDADRIQPASIDLTLGSTFAKRCVRGVIDPRDAETYDSRTCAVKRGEPYRLLPGAFVLATTAERVTIGPGLVGVVNGKSSLGRLALTIHATAGYIDPGFEGQITLEITNGAEDTILLWPGMAVCQIVLQRLQTPARRPYGHPTRQSKYQGQTGATASRYHENTI